MYVRVNGGVHEATPLIIASQEGKLETVQLLITKGNANVHVKDKLGRTALFMAALDKHINVTEHLLMEGAVIDVGDEDERRQLCGMRPFKVT